MDDNVKKVFQKRLYDLLSHKYGILTIIIGAFLLSISAFHFGEAWFEWSKEKYQVVFHSFSDNIAGKSYRERLSLPVPIDVVYTWINGTDPDTKRQLEEVRFQLQKQTNLTRETKCSYSNCLTVGVVVIPALPDTVTLEDLQSRSGDYGTIFTNVTSMVQMRIAPDVPANLTVLFQEKDVSPVVRRFAKGWPFQGTNHTVQTAYYTSDTTLTHGMPVPLLVMVSGFPSQDYTKDKLESTISSHLATDGKSAGLDLTVDWDKGVALLKASDKTQFEAAIGNKNLTIEGKALRLVPVTLVWDLMAPTQETEIADYRFQDKEELRYSLRSIERFAPWVRHIFIVTNGQIPYWLNMDNPRLTLITHKDIFPNASHLPTFSSPAIEANLHRIPGLSDKFLYLNDDVMFGVPVWPDDFYSHATGHKVHLAWPVPNCNDGCPSTWINDGYCDKACNSSECDWDGGDCTGDKGKPIQLGAGYHGGGGGIGGDSEDVYCQGGCSNSWLSDKYCDQSCNNLACGFDAGDCGVDHYNQLHRLNMSLDTPRYSLPAGETIAYFNLTNVLGSEGKVSAAKYASSHVVRVAAVSNKFKVLTLILIKGKNQTEIGFDMEYHRDNSTLKFNFTVSVETLNAKGGVTPPNDKLEGRIPRNASNANVTIHREKTQEELQDEMDAVAFYTSGKYLSHAQVITAKPLIPKSALGTMELELDVLSHFKHLNLSHDLHHQLIILEQAKDEGDLTDLGLGRKLHNLFSSFKDELVTVMPKLEKVKNEILTQKKRDSTDDNHKENIMSEGEKTEAKVTEKTRNEESPLSKSGDESKIPFNVEQGLQNNIKDTGKGKQEKISEVDGAVEDIEVANRHKKRDSLSPKQNQSMAHRARLMKGSRADEKNRREETKRTWKISQDNNDNNNNKDNVQLKDKNEEIVDELKVHGPGRKLLSMIPFLPSSYWKNKFQKAQEKRTRRIHKMRQRKMEEEEYLSLVSVENAGESVHPLPWEDRMETNRAPNVSQGHIEKKGQSNSNAYVIEAWQGRQLLDAFGDSLRHVNQLYNKAFGFSARKALAHMPHMVDKNIMTELQERFHKEWDATSSHQIRHPKDMQFAFAYYYYVMGVTVLVTPEEVFDEIDTDKSGVLSDRELRTLATKLYDLPLYLEVLTGLENMLVNCSQHQYQLEHHEDSTDVSSVTTPAAQNNMEVYYDKNMPQVTRELFLNCDTLLELVKKRFTPRPKYKTTIMDDSDTAFKIIHSNVSRVVGQLDDIRKNPKKFICLNDNMDHTIEEAKTVTAVLQDFYESVLPIPSQFELSRDYRNRFLNMEQLREWREYRDWLQFWTHVALAVLIIFTILSFLGDKIESMGRKMSRRFRRRSASPSSSSSSTSTSTSSSSSLSDLKSSEEPSGFLSGIETV